MQKSKSLSATQRAELQAIIRCPGEEYGVGRRANAILLLDDGLSYAAVAQVLYLDDGPVGKRSLYSIDPKSGHRFSDKLMDNKGKYTQNIRVPECSEYITKTVYISPTKSEH